MLKKLDSIIETIKRISTPVNSKIPLIEISQAKFVSTAFTHESGIHLDSTDGVTRRVKVDLGGARNFHTTEFAMYTHIFRGMYNKGENANCSLCSRARELASVAPSGSIDRACRGGGSVLFFRFRAALRVGGQTSAHRAVSRVKLSESAGFSQKACLYNVF